VGIGVLLLGPVELGQPVSARLSEVRNPQPEGHARRADCLALEVPVEAEVRHKDIRRIALRRVPFAGLEPLHRPVQPRRLAAPGLAGRIEVDEDEALVGGGLLQREPEVPRQLFSRVLAPAPVELGLPEQPRDAPHLRLAPIPPSGHQRDGRELAVLCVIVRLVLEIEAEARTDHAVRDHQLVVRALELLRVAQAAHQSVLQLDVVLEQEEAVGEAEIGVGHTRRPRRVASSTILTADALPVCLTWSRRLRRVRSARRSLRSS
jgi:hypothetical protein